MHLIGEKTCKSSMWIGQDIEMFCVVLLMCMILVRCCSDCLPVVSNSLPALAIIMCMCFVWSCCNCHSMKQGKNTGKSHYCQLPFSYHFFFQDGDICIGYMYNQKHWWRENAIPDLQIVYVVHRLSSVSTRYLLDCLFYHPKELLHYYVPPQSLCIDIHTHCTGRCGIFTVPYWLFYLRHSS